MLCMKVLVLSAHADDEVIGIGGTLHKLADAGAVIRLVLFSDGAEGYTRIEEQPTIVAQRHRETAHVCNILGISEYVNLHGLDWNLKVDNAGYREVIRQIREFQPDLMFTHSRADYNDHRVVHDVGVEGWFHASVPCAMALGPIRRPASLYEFEVLHPIVNPSLVVDITDSFDAKVEAMHCYASQHDLVGDVFQLMEGRAMARGFLIGVKYGEALSRTTYRPYAIHDIRDLSEGARP